MLVAAMMEGGSNAKKSDVFGHFVFILLCGSVGDTSALGNRRRESQSS